MFSDYLYHTVGETTDSLIQAHLGQPTVNWVVAMLEDSWVILA